MELPASIKYLISIDIGAYGFATYYCPPGAPSLQRMVHDWNDGRSNEINKNLTAILIRKETMETVAIGFKAEELYTKAHEKKEDQDFLYFHNFLSHLYSSVICNFIT